MIWKLLTRTNLQSASVRETNANLSFSQRPSAGTKFIPWISYKIQMTMVLEDFIVSSIPKTAIYIPNFISATEEKELIQKVYSAPKPKWTQLKNRRLINYGGIPHPKGMIAEKMPEWLQKCINRIDSHHIFEEKCAPNHVLINEYEPGQGIMPHVDGPLFHPIITTINCGSHTVLRLEAMNQLQTSQNNFSLLLEPRSLLILRDDLYTDYLHSIEDILEDTVDGSIRNLHLCEEKYVAGQLLKRSVRLSFTIRHVPRCSNFKLRF